MQTVIGWDIGGVNTKVARVAGGEVVAVRVRPFELQRDPQGLMPLLRALADEVGVEAASVHAVTMTAELSQMFRTKREGVHFVLDAVEAAFRPADIQVYAVDGRFLPTDAARQNPLAVAAANWSATAHAVAQHYANAVLIDVGTTTADIIPIVGGTIAAMGWTDPERLSSGELVYTGALRTPAEAMASEVVVHGLSVGVSAEGFALAGDVHLWRGDLTPALYTVPTPDGRPATREFAGERLARVVCADREMLDDRAISEIADSLAGAQVDRLTEALARILSRYPSLTKAVVAGLGAFIAETAAERMGLDVAPLAEELGEAAARAAPAAAVALLVDGVHGGGAARTPATPLHSGPHNHRVVDAVVKLGGSLLKTPAMLRTVLGAIAEAARRHTIVVVPGGGPFADAVREVDQRFRLRDDAAHWMAVLAMDQYAQFVAASLEGGELATNRAAIAARVTQGRIPVLAPFRWLQEIDPLPHSWEVTSDSIAAWAAGALGARQLVLVKAASAEGDCLTDAYFARALPQGVEAVIVTADRIDSLDQVLRR
jgi:(4-(4-[2-(gamma-L-glutamylamino)ethyl]phenoxymethyl)furan-2-yl)methanamine synthase